jgi:hypothetical protein
MLSLRSPALPYEAADVPPRPIGFVAGCTALLFLSILEILAFTVGGLCATVAAYIWFTLGAFSVAFLCWRYIAAVLADLRRGALWGLLPLAAGIPVCFFFIDSYAFLNTESLSELHDTYQQLKKPDYGYTSVFWFSYPTRSLILNLLPTALAGISPWSYRVGFSYPILLGALFLFTGIRRYHLKARGASAVAGITAAAVFSYPMFCQISRSFEMAISSASFGMWAIGALLLFAAEPTVITALVAAWTIGLLSASFTSGLALVALVILLMTLWAIRAFVRRDRAVAWLVSSAVVNCVVFFAALYLVRPRALRSKQIPFAEMWANFTDALGYSFSFSQAVFTPTELVIPTFLATLFALSLRGGLVSLILTAWCFPVIWSATNLHGKIGPQLPFALYRSLIIVPVLLYVVARLLLWCFSHLNRFPWAVRILSIALAIGMYFPMKKTYQSQSILTPPRPPEGREVISVELLSFIKGSGLTPLSEAWIANRTDERSVESFLPCLQYFLLNWKRIERGQPLPTESTESRTPGIIVTMPGDPLTLQSFPGYRAEVTTLPMTLSRLSQVTLSVVVLRPE